MLLLGLFGMNKMTKKKIKFAEIDVNNDYIKENLLDCCKNNWVTNGPKVQLFEENFKKIFGYKYACAVNSGTTADLLAALSLYDITTDAYPGENEIIVPALGFISAINAVWFANFKPRFCDINIDTLNIDEEKIPELITKKTKAILAINTMGRPCKMDKLKEICQQNALILISDNCEGHLCKYKDKPMRCYADAVTYSFYTAHLSFAVEMGMIGTNRQDIYESVLANRSHGRPHGNLLFEHVSIGWNGKPTDLHASVGLYNLTNIKDTFDKRTANLKYLLNGLNHLKNIFYLSPEFSTTEYTPCPHALSLTFKDDNEARFNRFFGYLEGKGIEAKLNFKCIPTQQYAYSRFYPFDKYFLQNAEFVGRNGLHLPVHQFLTRDDLDYIITTIKEFI